MRRFQPRTTPTENLRVFLRSIPWRLLVIIPVLIILAIPAYNYGIHAGQKIFPSITNYFYALSGPPPAATPTPLPAFITTLPQPGSLLYTVLAGDNCDEILSTQMHMKDAGIVFSDSKPDTVKALNASVGQNCSNLQPGMVLTLSPHYPLIAFGGTVLTVKPLTPQQVLPTPVIRVSHQEQLGIDCSDGCQLTVRIAANTRVHLFVQTALPIKVGSWVWAQAAYARKSVKGFDNYPYADPLMPLDGMSLRACDLQVDNTHDDNSLSCDQIMPNTIDDDHGAWLLGVVSPGSLGHWGYPLHLATGTRVLLWLTLNANGDLRFHKGNPVYRYDEVSHLFVKA